MAASDWYFADLRLSASFATAHGADDCSMQMTGGQSVWASEVPDHAAAVGPGKHSEAVRPFSIVSGKRVGFQHCWNIRGRQGPLDEVVDGVVSHVTTSGLATCESVDTRAVDLLATYASVRCAHCGTETQRDGDAQ